MATFTRAPRVHRPRGESAKRESTRTDTRASGASDRDVQREVASALRHGVSDPRSLSSREIQSLQRALGNQAVGQILGANQPAPAPAIQRRIENPHAKPIAHEGWDTTAHHIVPYSKLEAELAKLGSAKKAEVLKHAIPDVLTKAMLDNLKVAIDDSVEARANLRARLVGDEDDNTTIAGVKFGDIRESFFLWQGGNQFQGPNTTIRPEPSERKDALDTDIQYMGSMSQQNFQSLTTRGANLGSLEGEEAIAANLKAILDITKNVTPQDFDSAKWTEIGSKAEIERLAAHKGLDRAHLLKYAFFKVPIAQLGSEKTYDKITPVSGGEFQYEGITIPVQVKGTWAYLPYLGSQDPTYSPTTETQATLSAVLTKLGVEPEKSDGSYKLSVTADGPIKTVEGKKFTVGTYPDQIPYTAFNKVSENAGSILVAGKLFENRKIKTVALAEGKLPLFTYLTQKAAPTSTFLPKALYETLV